MEPKKDTPKLPSFKEYRAKKKIETMETSFGNHSLPKKPDSMSTSFGKHSEKVDEKISEVSDIPRTTTEEHDHIHDVVAPIGKISGKKLEAVTDYSDDSRQLNGMLHHHDKGSINIYGSNNKQYRDTVKHLDSALNERKTTEDMHVYTGIKYSPSRHFARVAGKVESKKVVKLPAYTSTSSSFHSAREFSDLTMHPNDDRHGIEHDEDVGEARHVLKIHVPKGTHAMSLKKHSFAPTEHEVLLHRGHHIEIDAKPTKTDKLTYVWNARIVGHHPQPIIDTPENEK